MTLARWAIISILTSFAFTAFGVAVLCWFLARDTEALKALIVALFSTFYVLLFMPTVSSETRRS